MTSTIFGSLFSNIKRCCRLILYIFYPGSRISHFSKKPWFLFKLFLFFSLLGPHLQHMEIPRPRVKLELQLPTTATAVPGSSCICDLCQSLWKRGILNPLGEARDWTCNLMETSRVLNPLSHKGNSLIYSTFFYFKKLFIYFCLFFRATPLAYGNSQVRGWIRAVAACLHHSNARYGPYLGPTPKLTATPDP